MRGQHALNALGHNAQGFVSEILAVQVVDIFKGVKADQHELHLLGSAVAQ